MAFATRTIIDCPNNSNNIVIIQIIIKMDKLKNKIAVITGGSSGIGLATAKEFIANGAKVVIFARDKQTLGEAVKQLGSNSFAVQGDVCKMPDLDNLFAETKARFGGVDILFVNAAQAKLA